MYYAELLLLMSETGADKDTLKDAAQNLQLQNQIENQITKTTAATVEEMESEAQAARADALEWEAARQKIEASTLDSERKARALSFIPENISAGIKTGEQWRTEKLAALQSDKTILENRYAEIIDSDPVLKKETEKLETELIEVVR